MRLGTVLLLLLLLIVVGGLLPFGAPLAPDAPAHRWYRFGWPSGGALGALGVILITLVVLVLLGAL